ncbi:HPF/RaiA family ribosome-associated protein [Azospirillum sp. ST 5-10]|uniref:HPF/RaiA family ribosome-associated protein n=1 Tax=unclassified Azospirillum TaxID=2630922 RepID=UPI003F4A5BDF
MRLPLQITFRNMDPSPALEETIRGHAARLERFCDDITSCRIEVEAPHRHHHRGKLYVVRIDVTVPHGELVAGRHRPEDHAHEDPKVAIRDTFDAVRRELEDHARRLRLDVKTHAVPLHGRVERLFAADGYGFVRTADGQEVYFHRNSVPDGGFDALTVGAEVRLSVAEGESPEGPQATTVMAVGKHHPVGEETVPAA